MRLSARAYEVASIAAAGLAFSYASALAQGVPVIDSNRLRQELAILHLQEEDVTRQRTRADRKSDALRVDQEIIQELDKIIGSATLPSAATSDMVQSLEDGAGDSSAAAASLYNPDDTNPAAEQNFGDAAASVEQVIIDGAKTTYGLPGVSAAGLSLPQWRALLQALIWQESRFNPFVGSPVGAWGLTQLMPGTAADVGVASDYRTNPRSQVIGGATYLSRMLAMFDGNIVTALAAYNAGPGNVQRYGGVPPFAETQNYVVVIPQKYNEYLAKIGGIDSLGTIDAGTVSAANFSIASAASAEYSNHAASEIRAIAYRTRAIITAMQQSENPTQSWALNTYARAEMARIISLQTRVLSTQSKVVSADALQQAAAHASERNYMKWDN